MNSHRGFSMVEMAMVLLVFSMLMGGMLMPMASQYQNQRRSETIKKLNGITETVYGYVLVNGRLPCPDVNGDGREDRKSSKQCKKEAGTLPWLTLAVDSTDAWGRPWLYRVSGKFADAEEGTGCGDTIRGISFALCSKGTIRVKDRAGKLEAENLPVIVLSEGQNRWQSKAERENRDNDTEYIKDVYSNVKGNEFDDLLVWLTTMDLSGRLVLAGKKMYPDKTGVKQGSKGGYQSIHD